MQELLRRANPFAPRPTRALTTEQKTEMCDRARRVTTDQLERTGYLN